MLRPLALSRDAVGPAGYALVNGRLRV